MHYALKVHLAKHRTTLQDWVIICAKETLKAKK